MREKKFRGLTKEGKRVYGWYAAVKGKRFIIPTDAPITDDEAFLRSWNEVLPGTVGQGTGFKDKNDKNEIYQGDKVLCADNTHGSIVWKGSGWYLEKLSKAHLAKSNIPTWKQYIQLDYCHKTIEVIGVRGKNNE